MFCHSLAEPFRPEGNECRETQVADDVLLARWYNRYELPADQISPPGSLMHQGGRVKVINVDNDGKRIPLSMKTRSRILGPTSPAVTRSARSSPGASSARPTSATSSKSSRASTVSSTSPSSRSALSPTESVQIGANVTGWVREVDPSKKRLSLSLREIVINDPWEGVQQKYPIGKIMEATVDHGGAAGVFVQLEPGLTCLVPHSEISIPAGADAARAFKPGEKLIVRVRNVDPTRKRISLGADAAKTAAERDEYVKFMEECNDEVAWECGIAGVYHRFSKPARNHALTRAASLTYISSPRTTASRLMLEFTLKLLQTRVFSAPPLREDIAVNYTRGCKPL